MAWIVLYSLQVMLACQIGISHFFREKAETKVDIGYFRGNFECLLEAHMGWLQKAVFNVFQALKHQCGWIGRV